MRALHLFFRLHRAYDLKPIEDIDTEIFGIEAEFREVNRIEYQPLFAILERNVQKYPKLHISIGVSGVWLEQAEKWDPELIRRLKRLVNLGNVELLACPYNYSLSSFYDEEEFLAQMEAERKIFARMFGVEPALLAMPELLYHDKIAAAAEQAGYKGVLAGAVEKILDFRTPNQVFEAVGCKKLRVLAQNTKFSEAIRQASELATVEELRAETEFMTAQPGEIRNDLAGRPRVKATAAEFVQGMTQARKPAFATETVRTVEKLSGRRVFSAPKYLKELELEALRGNLINICLDPTIFRKYRDVGVVRFLDDLIQGWLKNGNNHFYNASEMIDLMVPRVQLTVKTAVSVRPERARVGEAGLAVVKDIQYRPPEWLSTTLQVELEKALYGIRDEVLKTGDEDLYRDFARLTAVDYILGLTEEKRTHFEKVLGILKDRVIAKLPQPTKLAAKADGKVAAPEVEKEDFSVKVKRVPKAKTTKKTKMAPKKQPRKVEQLSNDEMEVQDWNEVVWELENIGIDREDTVEDDVGKDAETVAAEEVLAERISRQLDEVAENVETLTEAEVVETKKPKVRTKKKLVIE